MQHFPIIEKLHTDVLEEKYGSISSKVLMHSKKIRKSHLIDSKGISRTYAITFFTGEFIGEIAKINEEIKNGKPIGKAFREHGFAIRKNVIGVTIVPLTKELRKDFATKEKNAKSRFSEFYAKKRGSKPIIYGTVAEIYSPTFRKPKINQFDKSQVSAVTKILEKHRFKRKDIWLRIGDENNYEDVKTRFDKAKKESISFVRNFRKKVIKQLDKKDLA